VLADVLTGERWAAVQEPDDLQDSGTSAGPFTETQTSSATD